MYVCHFRKFYAKPQKKLLNMTLSRDDLCDTLAHFMCLDGDAELVNLTFNMRDFVVDMFLQLY